MSIENQTKQGMQQALDHFKQELKNLRSSRANPGMLDGVHVEAYGTQMRLKELANVTAPEARQLLVTPFDPSTTNAIAKGIEAANLGVRAIVDGHIIRINIPPMDESLRKDIVKICKKKSEEAKVAIREVRRKNNETVKKQKADGIIPEDAMKKLEKSIQDLTDKFCKDIDTLCAEKEKEILSI
ncbi:MAG TPA: ribosome recycling factor [Chlamydiales bacterium]|nr:ribosome recycling factor [Chlamydiales bacterium]